MDFNVQDTTDVIESQIFITQTQPKVPLITRGSEWKGSQVTKFRQIPLYGDSTLKNIVGTINFTYNYISTQLPNTTDSVPNISIGKKVNITINPTKTDPNFYIITYLVYTAQHLNELYDDYQAAIINVTKNNNVQVNSVDGAFLTGICKRVLQSDNSTRMINLTYINAKESELPLPAGPYYYTIDDYSKANIYEYN
jgi:hypothetical protein